MDLHQKTARYVGALFLLAMLSYGLGFGLISAIIETPDYLKTADQNRLQFTLGAILMLVNSAAIVGIALMLTPLLNQHNRQIALGYLCSRLMESIILIFGIICLLAVLSMSQQYNIADAAPVDLPTLSSLAIKLNNLAYQIAMIVLGCGSLFLCYLFFQSQLIPRFLAIWGFLGYAALMSGAVLELFGFKLGLIFSIPGGLFEIVFPFWLFYKGFNSAAIVPYD